MVDWPRAIQELKNKGNINQYDRFCLKCFRATATSSFCEHADCDSEETIEWQDWRQMSLCHTGIMFREPRKWLLVRL